MARSPLSNEPPTGVSVPDIPVGSLVKHRGSTTGRAEVLELLWVNGKPKHGGPRWRALVRFPQNRASEVGAVGRMVVQHVDVDRLVLVPGEPQGRLF